MEIYSSVVGLIAFWRLDDRKKKWVREVKRFSGGWSVYKWLLRYVKNSEIDVFERVRFLYWRYDNLTVCIVGVAVRKGRKVKKNRVHHTFRGDVKWTQKKLPFERLPIRKWRSKFTAKFWRNKKKCRFDILERVRLLYRSLQLDTPIVLTFNLIILWRNFPNLSMWKNNVLFLFIFYVVWLCFL